MSKKVQFAHSYPVLPSDPAGEAGRVTFYTKADGVYARVGTGTPVGPLAAAAADTGGGLIDGGTPTTNHTGGLRIDFGGVT